MKHRRFHTFIAGTQLLLLFLFTTINGCNSQQPRESTVVYECQRAFVFWHVQFMPPPTDEIPKLFLEKMDGTAIASDESGGGGKPCGPPASCGKSFNSDGIAPGTFRAYASYRGQKYYFTGNDQPITAPGNAQAATITAVGGKSYVLEMVVQL